MSNFIDGVKLWFSRDKEFRSALFDIMGFYPHNVEFYRIAFAHKSQEYKSKKTGDRPLNNERLEYLGDAVLETVVSDIVYHHFQNKREGFLTNTRSKIVSRESLGKLAKELGIDRLIQSNTYSKAHNSFLEGNAFEALMGAIYLDRGFDYAFRFIEKRIIGQLLDLESVAHKEVNFKSKLLEYCQKNRLRIDFKDKQTGTSGNNPSFEATIIIEGLFAGDGRGFSKKEAHQNAAREALTRMRREPKMEDEIFRSKEKRTAMEADPCFVLPVIEEIEQDLAREAENKQKETPKPQAAKTQPAKPQPSKPQPMKPEKSGNNGKSGNTEVPKKKNEEPVKPEAPKAKETELKVVEAAPVAEETPAPTPKKKHRVRGKRQNAESFTNTEPVAAETSHRAEKAAAKTEEIKREARRRRAHKDLKKATEGMDLPEDMAPVKPEETPVETPKTTAPAEAPKPSAPVEAPKPSAPEETLAEVKAFIAEAKNAAETPADAPVKKPRRTRKPAKKSDETKEIVENDSKEVPNVVEETPKEATETSEETPVKKPRRTRKPATKKKAETPSEAPTTEAPATEAPATEAAAISASEVPAKKPRRTRKTNKTAKNTNSDAPAKPVEAPVDHVINTEK